MPERLKQRRRLIRIFIDADSCPVKKEIYEVAKKYGISVLVVANNYIRTPVSSLIQMVTVGSESDEADLWISENCLKNDIVVTSDLPLASLCIKKEARVLTPKGKVLTEDSITGSMMNREISAFMREMGDNSLSRSAPYSQKDRSRFLQYLHQLIQSALRAEVSSGTK